jgi:hypothetical protein
MEDKENDNECIRYIRFIKNAADYHPFTGECRDTTIIDMLCFNKRLEIIGFGLIEKKKISNNMIIDKIITEMQKEEFEVYEGNRELAYSLNNTNAKITEYAEELGL